MKKRIHKISIYQRTSKFFKHLYPHKKHTLYLAVFLDVYSKRVVGWAMDARMKDQFVISAFNQVYGKEHPEAGFDCSYRSGGSVYWREFLNVEE